MANPFNFFINPFKGLNKVVTTYTTPGSGTWTCPAGVTEVYVECWGASAGSGAAISPVPFTYMPASDGVGGGAFAAGWVSVTPGNTYDYVVGAGGTKGTGPSPGTWPTAGGDSSFNSTSIIAKGSSERIGAQASACTGTIKYSGGNGNYGPNSQYSGGGGSSAGPLGDGTDASGVNGGNSSDPDAGDGGHGRNTQGAGTSGTAPGGGPGGPYCTTAGTYIDGVDGTPGQVRITYYT